MSAEAVRNGRDWRRYVSVAVVEDMIGIYRKSVFTVTEKHSSTLSHMTSHAVMTGHDITTSHDRSHDQYSPTPQK